MAKAKADLVRAQEKATIVQGHQARQKFRVLKQEQAQGRAATVVQSIYRGHKYASN